jgi:hypothetical protein
MNKILFRFAPFLPLLLWFIFIGATFTTPLNRILLDILMGNRDSLGREWKLVDHPNLDIVSAASTFNDLYITTADKRAYYSRLLDEGPSSFQLFDHLPNFENAPRVFAAGSDAFLVDGIALYASDGTRINHPLVGPIHEAISNASGWFLSGDHQILFTSDKGSHWQDLWTGEPVESNLLVDDLRIFVASQNHLWSRGFEVDSAGQLHDEKQWLDTSGNLVDKPIQFLALGLDGVVAASTQTVYRSGHPFGAWEPVKLDLPFDPQISKLSGGNRSNSPVAVFTKQGVFLSDEAENFQLLTGYGDITAFTFYDETFESTIQRSFLITRSDIWYRRYAADFLGVLIYEGELLLLLALSIIPALVIMFVLIEVLSRFNAGSQPQIAGEQQNDSN